MLPPPIEPARVCLISCSMDSSIIYELAQELKGNHDFLNDGLLFDLDISLPLAPDVYAKIALRQGQHTDAQREVISHPRFVHVVLSAVAQVQSEVAGRVRVYFFVDINGTRSDVVARTVQSLLNKAEVDVEGRSVRAFECEHWPLARVDGRELKDIAGAIYLWLHTTHTTERAEIDPNPERQYGFGATVKIPDWYVGDCPHRTSYNEKSAVCYEHLEALYRVCSVCPPTWVETFSLGVDHRISTAFANNFGADARSHYVKPST